MGNVKLDFVSRFEQSESIQVLAKRNRELALSGKRVLYGGYESNSEDFVYGWCGIKKAGKPGEERVELGDHACWIDIGPFPKLAEVPSRVNGPEMTCESWGRDYAFMIDNTPANIHSCERIVGEIYWYMHQIRDRNLYWELTGEEIVNTGKIAREMGCGGGGEGHTCPDLAIGLEQGYGKILERVRESKVKYERLQNDRKVNFLCGLEAISKSCIRFIDRYADLATELAATALVEDEKKRYERIAACCRHIATEPPRDFYEAVQWIHFAILFDRSVGHGNGYGRLDLYLIDYYKKGIVDKTLSRSEAREYIAEMYMKLRGHFFSVGGRDIDGNDATNDMSWIVLEAYDLVGDYNNLGVMWHSDIDSDFYEYACDVLARHGESTPVLINYDLMYESEIRSGIPHEHAWNVVYSGCQWYSIPGREYCEHDTNTIVVIEPMRRSIDRCIDERIEDFETLYRYFEDEIRKTGIAFRNFKRVKEDHIGDLWPEMFTSLLCHGPIERGLDIVAPRGVDYQFTSVNVLGIPNVADSLHAIRNLVFGKKLYTLEQVKNATASNWKDDEYMRQQFLNQEKYGNDIDSVDALYVRVADSLSDILGTLRNQKGQEFRISLFHFQGQAFSRVIGATPDGRRATDYLAHGVNPTVGMNTKGLIPTSNSLSKVDPRKFAGVSQHVDLQPRFFDGKDEIWKYIRDFSIAYFKNDGMQINLHIMDFEKLKDAMENPDNPEYQNIVVRVTGYAARFVALSRSYQEEFVSRMNY